MTTTAKRIFVIAAALMMCWSANAAVVSADTVPAASPMSQMMSNLNPANWKMPDFKSILPAREEKARIKKKKDGLMSEVGTTASNSWNRTKEVLNPQKLNPINYFPASARTPSTKEPEKEAKPGFFRSLFFPEPEEEKEAGTVTDFLRQSRPAP